MVDPVIKSNEISMRFSMFEGTDFFEFPTIAISEDLTIVSYTVVYALFHCGNEDCLGRSK